MYAEQHLSLTSLASSMSLPLSLSLSFYLAIPLVRMNAADAMEHSAVASCYLWSVRPVTKT